MEKLGILEAQYDDRMVAVVFGTVSLAAFIGSRLAVKPPAKRLQVGGVEERCNKHMTSGNLTTNTYILLL